MDQPTSPFAGKPIGSMKAPRPAFIEVGTDMVPTDLYGFCDYMNDKNVDKDGQVIRRGHYYVKETERPDKSVHRELSFRDQNASSNWLQERGLIPNMTGRNRRA